MAPSSATSAVKSPSLALTRRHAAGSSSARGLLFTVLGEFVLPAGGEVWTASLIDVLGKLGVEEKATRQALMRTAAAGWLTSRRHGRHTRWRLTPSAEQLLTDGTRRIFGFTPVTKEWDGRVLLVLARVPESDRSTRHLLRTRLGWAGFGSPAPGLWISTHTERADEIENLLRGASVEGRVFIAEPSHRTDLVEMVRQAWDIEAVEARYQEFLDEFADPKAGRPLIRVVELVHAWRRFPSIDPGLPRDLLPTRWSGERAAKLFARRHATWAANANTEWAALENASRIRTSLPTR